MSILRARLALPYLAGLSVLVAIPAAAGLGLAFTEFSGIERPSWVGLDNFERMLSDDLFWTALGNSAIYVALAVPLRIVAALGFALLLHRRSRGTGAA
ncbi:MAG TPA: sugar ABC transporter permease, partial [Actinomycetota bacterium]|nr:sugar ABC transporter permease [Actinomycetota bacterium]